MSRAFKLNYMILGHCITCHLIETTLETMFLSFQNQSTIILKDILHCPDMGLTLVSIRKITNAGHKVISRNTTCKIYDKKDKVIGQINARNGLYHVDHKVTVNITMAGEDWEVLTIEELHRHMGHIAPETARQMVSKGAIKGIEIDSASEIQHCDSCKYAKATQKPIQKECQSPRVEKSGDEIYSDVWGPSPIQTPGHKSYYVSFTGDHTRWIHLQLLATKDGIFQAYKDFKAWAKLHSKILAYNLTEEENIWGQNSANISNCKE